MDPRLVATASTAVVIGALAGCASRGVDATWSDPQLAGNPLRGSRVLVACEAAEVVLARLCLDQLGAELRSRGATVVTAPEVTPPQPGQVADDGRYLAPARSAGATAIWAATLVPQALVEGRGSSFSIGLGGFTGGRSGGVGVGVGVPIGSPAAPAPQYAADARLTDAANGRLLWTARASAGSSGEAAKQIEDLAQRLVGAAADAKLF